MKSVLKFVSLALAMFGMLFASCTKNDENTIVLIGEERYIDDILTVIPDTLKPTFDAIFGNIPEGPVPPKIEGSYVVDPKQRVSTNVDYWPLTVIEKQRSSLQTRFSSWDIIMILRFILLKTRHMTCPSMTSRSM